MYIICQFVHLPNNWRCCFAVDHIGQLGNVSHDNAGLTCYWPLYGLFVVLLITNNFLSYQQLNSNTNTMTILVF